MRFPDEPQIMNELEWLLLVMLLVIVLLGGWSFGWLLAWERVLSEAPSSEVIARTAQPATDAVSAMGVRSIIGPPMLRQGQTNIREQWGSGAQLLTFGAVRRLAQESLEGGTFLAITGRKGCLRFGGSFHGARDEKRGCCRGGLPSEPRGHYEVIPSDKAMVRTTEFYVGAVCSEKRLTF